MAREKVFVNPSFTSEIIGERYRTRHRDAGEIKPLKQQDKKEQDTKWAQKCATRGGFSGGAV